MTSVSSPERTMTSPDSPPRTFTLAAKPRALTPLDPATVTLSVLIPVYNELNTIETILDRVHATPVRKEIICVDDYSTDGTRERLVALHEAGYIDRLVLQPENGGKGKAIRTALSNSTGDIVIVQDADLEYDPADWPVLLEPIIAGKADACFGSRFLGGPHRVLYYWLSVGNTLLTLWSNMLTNLNLTDMETCYKVFRREVLQSFTLEENRFGIEPELTAKVAAGRWRVYEVGISYSGRTYEEGKKIGLKDAFRALYCIGRYAPALQRRRAT